MSLSCPLAPPAPQHPSKIIEFYGDSTTWGSYGEFTASGEVKQAYPRETDLIKVPGYEVKNHAINGSWSLPLLAGDNHGLIPWRTRMEKSNASIVVLSYGINDAKNITPEAYWAVLYTLVEAARDNGKVVIFETPNPVAKEGLFPISAFVKMMLMMGSREGIPVIDQYNYLMKYLNGRDVREICPDGTHPSLETYKLKGQFANLVLNRLLTQPK